MQMGRMLHFSDQKATWNITGKMFSKCICTFEIHIHIQLFRIVLESPGIKQYIDTIIDEPGTEQFTIPLKLMPGLEYSGKVTSESFGLQSQPILFSINTGLVVDI